VQWEWCCISCTWVALQSASHLKNLTVVLTTWHSWVRASWYNCETNQQDVTIPLNLLFQSALHVSGDVFAHHQEYLTVFTVSGSIHPSGYRMVSWLSFQLNQDTSLQQLVWTLPDNVNTVKCSWWWPKTSPETCRADWNNKLSCIVTSCWLLS